MDVSYSLVKRFYLRSYELKLFTILPIWSLNRLLVKWLHANSLGATALVSTPPLQHPFCRSFWVKLVMWPSNFVSMVTVQVASWQASYWYPLFEYTQYKSWDMRLLIFIREPVLRSPVSVCKWPAPKQAEICFCISSSSPSHRPPLPRFCRTQLSHRCSHGRG